jgi:hypothetical protein
MHKGTMMPTLNEVLTEASKDRRVCPKPDYWNRLWKLLPDRLRKGVGWEPPPPLILGAWWHTSNSQKRERFHNHIRWADQHGALDTIAELIFRLNPEDLHRED